MNEIIVGKVYKIQSEFPIKPIGDPQQPKGAIVELDHGAEYVFEPPKQFLNIKDSIFTSMRAAVVDGFKPGKLKGYQITVNDITIESKDGLTFVVKR